MLLSTNMGLGGGAEEQVVHLATVLHRRGWKVRIVSMLPTKPMPPDFDYAAIPVDHLGMSRGMPDPRSIWRLSRMIREFRPDVIHSHMNHANLLARVVRLISPVPVVIGTLHALTMAGVEVDHTRRFELAHRYTDFLSERTTTICHSAADYYRQCRAVPDAKMAVVANGIDTDRYSFNAQARQRVRSELGLADEFVWLAVARLESAKAYPTLLHAFAQLSEAVSGTLLICGVGSLKTELIELTRNLGIDHRVRFLGLRKDIAHVLSAADALALSSNTEGLPLALLQAAAAGLPIVATDVGGNSEVVVDGLNGRLVPAADIDRFAQAMSEILLLSADARKSMGEAGRLRVESMFQTDRVVDQWENIFTELLERTRYEDTYRPRRWASAADQVRDCNPPSWSPGGQFRTGES